MGLDEWKALAKQLDAKDPLARYREQFYIQPGTIYLDGNSLGLLSKPAEVAVYETLDDWKRRAVSGWNEGDRPWFFMAERLAGMVAPLIGAAREEVIVTNSTTVNLHQLATTLYKPTENRFKILIDETAFPSDAYALASQMRLHGLDPSTGLVRVKADSRGILYESAIINALDSSIALAVLPVSVYTTGQLLDVPRIAKAANRRGILIGFDCSHSVGVVPHQLAEWGVDFAFWCSYKYLSAGPGACGGLYLNRRHLGSSPGLAGWFSSRKERQFDMQPELLPSDTASALQIGTPNILSMAPLLGTLPMILEARVESIRKKSLELTGFLIDLVDSCLAQHAFELVTPREDERRGGHIALRHRHAVQICHALRASGVLPDFRPPDIVRLGPSPLYTSFEECLTASIRLGRIMEDHSYERFPLERQIVS